MHSSPHFSYGQKGSSVNSALPYILIFAMILGIVPVVQATNTIPSGNLTSSPVVTPDVPGGIIQPAGPEYDFGAAASVSDMLSATPPHPASPVKLVFIHHSTGQNWLDDGNGKLAIALRDNNYFVSDTNYGWGPDSIGSSTDIGNWYDWFRGPKSQSYLYALFNESGQTFTFSRLSPDPGGQNKMIMFKSCFPNSAFQGKSDDSVPSIDMNPLKGQSAGSSYHTVANAKGIYMDLLNYFSSKQDTLFVVITAPPLTDPTYSGNARAFNQWLVNDWLRDYPYKNVFVYDFYNVLTTNGGNPSTNDLDATTGNHHRWWNGYIQHQVNLAFNISAYPSGDDHPSQAGNLKATAEFIPVLNYAYNQWISAASHIGVFRNGLWVIDYNGNYAWDGASTDRAVFLGQANDNATIGDWNGNGKGKIGIFRNGLWVIDYSGNYAWDGPSVDRAVFLGQAGDTPVVGNWSGTGTGKFGIFRNGLWVLDYNGNFSWDGPSVDRAVFLGQAGDNPVVGNWNGDSTGDKIGVFRNGLWVIDYNGNYAWDGPSVDRAVFLGQAGDIPVVGDWNGDGKKEIGVFRNGLWVLDYNGNYQWDGPTTDRAVYLGQAGDTPVIGDWNGDGKFKIGIFRNGLWVIDYNGNYQWDGPSTDRAVFLGHAGDTPVVGKWS